MTNWLLILMNEYFNRNLNRQYSWLPKGVTSSVVWPTITGRWSTISWILSNNEFLSLIVDDTGDSNKFCKFLCILKYALNFINAKLYSKWNIIIDNTSTHRAKQTSITLKRLNFNVMFLPPYSPILAPIELFFRMVKNRIRAVLTCKNMCFNDQKDRLEIFDAISDWDKSWISKMCIQFIANAKQSILKFY